MKLLLRLHGPFIAMWADRTPCRVTGAKQQALLALLASASELTRSRAWLISILWSDHDEAQGRRNLRQLLHGLRAVLGERYCDVIGSVGDLLFLRPQHFSVIGNSSDGVFLEGIDLCEEGFEDWLREMRQRNAAQVQTAVQPDRPEQLRHRLMVLPLREIGPKTQAGLGDALAHQLSVVFARSGLLDTISHLSSREIAQSGDTENAACVDYRLVGRCYPMDSRIAVEVTLEDVNDGHIVWGASFSSGDLLQFSGDGALVNEIAGQVLWTIMAKSSHATSVLPLGSAKTHALMLSGVAQMHSFMRNRFMDARAMLDEVAARCPEHSMPLAWLAQWHLLSVHQGWSADALKSRRLAGEAINRALDLNPYCDLSLTIDGNLCNVMDGNFSLAGQRFESALAINPSSAMTCQLAALHRSFTGRGTEAVALTERTRSLAPRDPRKPFFAGLGATAYLAAERWEDAVEHADIALRHNPHHVSAHRCRVIGLQNAGKESQAALAAQELLAVSPDLTVSEYQRSHPAMQTPVGQIWANALAGAGVPLN